MTCTPEAHVATLVEALRAARKHSPQGYTFLDSQLREKTLSFEALYDTAAQRARALRGLGLLPGDRLAMVVADSCDFVTTFFGAVLAGVVPVPMFPPTSRSRLQAYMDTCIGILRGSGARALLTSREAAPLAGPLVAAVASLEQLITVDALDEPGTPRPALDHEPQPQDPCFLQFTSGSTSHPKGVVVSHANVVANALAIMRDGLQSDPAHDRGLSWLPLYHDMGLIGFVLAPLVVGVPVVFMPTLTFVKRPQAWLQCISKYRATITFAPNFAFALCNKRAAASQGLDLSCLRVLGCGAEPINPATIREFLAQHADAGLDPRAFIACYGMAEATLAVAFEALDAPLRTLRVDRDALAIEQRAQPAQDCVGQSVELVSCGRTFPGHELAIGDAAGRLLPDGCVGQVLFRGPSASAGYFGDSSASARLWRRGWLQTGDLGLLREGRLYLCGRQKDLIIVHGRNCYPQDLEWCVEQLPHVRSGSVVAFAAAAADSDGERLVLAAECGDARQANQVADAIRNQVAQTQGVVLDEVVLLPPGSVSKTTSGKVQRARMRGAYERGELEPLALALPTRRTAASAASTLNP